MTGRSSRAVRRWHAEGGEPPPTNRLDALTDGVFAIVMTLLVLELGVPVITDRENAALVEALREMWPEFLIYGLSFMVLGVFWLMHKMIFESVSGSNPQLVWLNISFLMFASLIPFTTALVGEHGVMFVTALVYGLNMLLLFGTLWAIWLYSTRHEDLIVEGLDPMLVRGGNLMGLVYLLAMAGTLGIAVASPLAAFVIYAGFMGTIILMTMLGRWESVMVLAREEEKETGSDG